MKKMVMALLLFVLLSVSVSSFADVYCSGIPSAAKVGEVGNQEAYLIVTLPGNIDYRLGTAEDALAKARFALVASATVSGRSIAMRFWGYSDCNTPSIDHAIPNSVQIY